MAQEARRPGKEVKAVRGVRGGSPLFFLPYFDAVENTILDTPMHLLKGVFQSHVLKVLLGKRDPGRVKAPVGELYPKKRGDARPKQKRRRKPVSAAAQREYMRRKSERKGIIKKLGNLRLTQEGAERGSSAYRALEGPPGYTKRRSGNLIAKKAGWDSKVSL
jgi:hypothetical protein